VADNETIKSKSQRGNVEAEQGFMEIDSISNLSTTQGITGGKGYNGMVPSFSGEFCPKLDFDREIYLVVHPSTYTVNHHEALIFSL
jgi:hypothetical protein